MTSMCKPEISYDEPSDTLYIDFEQCRCGTHLGLNDHVLLRVDSEKTRVLGIMLLDFSVLANRGEFGPRSFTMTGLDEMAPDLREMAMRLVHSQPVTDYLVVSAYSPPGAEAVPIVTLNTDKLVARAV